VTLVVTALSLGPSFAHVLEAPPRLTVWPPELWRETTVFNGQFRLFALVGGPLDAGAILAAAVLAYLLRHDRKPYWLALAGAVLFALSLTVWFLWVAPVNAVLATWTPGPIPENFTEIRNRWETGHMAVASIKLIGFILIALAVVLSRPAARLPREPSSR
jgi:hypothetical protein